MFSGLLILFLMMVASANPLKRARDSVSQNKGTDPKNYVVTKLPGLTKNIPNGDIPLMFAGQLELYHENNTHYFFWKFEDRYKAEETVNKTIFWLNGGPGCSSMDGALMESGPFRINDDLEVTYNKGSWHKKADLVFVDQPAGTGLSYGADFDGELFDVSWHFVRFLEKYYEVFPDDASYEIVLAGESYAGQYIPYIAKAIKDRNARVPESDRWNLKGMLIGNGYIAPNEQGLSLIPFAVQAKLISTDHPHWKDMMKAHDRCQEAVDRANAGKTGTVYEVVGDACDHVLNTILRYTRDRNADSKSQCLNMYDYTLKDSFPSCGMAWPPDLTNVTPFLDKHEVMQDLNLVFEKSWTECSGAVSGHLKARNSEPSVKLLPELLEEYEVVLFHGNRDIICNYIGAERMIKNLSWGGKTGFSEDLPEYDWLHNETTRGYIKSERNLTFVNVFDASHMVPFDKPEISRALVDIFFKRYEITEGEKATKPKIRTQSLNRGDSSVDSAFSVYQNGTGNSTYHGETSEQVHVSRIVRVIQLAVIVVMIWGVCAIYSTYRSKPTSIIKTKPAGRKKNVSWADQLKADDAEFKQEGSLISKAINKLKKPDNGTYKPITEDIEMGENICGHPDDFIIESDDEHSR